MLIVYYLFIKHTNYKFIIFITNSSGSSLNHIRGGVVLITYLFHLLSGIEKTIFLENYSVLHMDIKPNLEIFYAYYIYSVLRAITELLTSDS